VNGHVVVCVHSFFVALTRIDGAAARHTTPILAKDSNSRRALASHFGAVLSRLLPRSIDREGDVDTCVRAERERANSHVCHCTMCADNGRGGRFVRLSGHSPVSRMFLGKSGGTR
jgi:hypothetical protein